MGPTKFAVGEWCGVELDEPRGKNDGSVEGERYIIVLYFYIASFIKVKNM